MVRYFIESHLPNLAGSHWDIISPETSDYNCIAWAVSDKLRPWWPNDPDYFWPSNAPGEETVEAFLTVFSQFGFEQKTSATLEKRYDKIALFVDHNNVPTHAARQLSSGMWTSKLGQSFDIEHMLDAVEGDQYGKVTVILKRPKPWYLRLLMTLLQALRRSRKFFKSLMRDGSVELTAALLPCPNSFFHSS